MSTERSKIPFIWSHSAQLLLSGKGDSQYTKKQNMSLACTGRGARTPDRVHCKHLLETRQRTAVILWTNTPAHRIPREERTVAAARDE
jgi:hypothetical protein